MNKFDLYSSRTLMVAIGAAVVVVNFSFGHQSLASGTKSQTLATILAPYQKLHSFQCTIQMQATLTPVQTGPATNIFNTIEVSYLAPNKLHLDITGLGGGSEMVSDGKVSYTYSSMTNTYSVADVPKSPVSMMVQSVGKIQSLHLTGQAVVDGKPCNIYTGVTKADFGKGKVSIAINAANSLVQRISLTMPNIGTPRGTQYKVDVTEDYTNQKINPSIPSSVFHFQPPAGAQKGSGSSLPSLLGAPGGAMP